MYRFCTIAVLLFVALSSCKEKSNTPAITGTAKVSFKNIVNGSSLVLNSGIYTNVFGESYSIKKLKYYISNVELSNSTVKAAQKESYHLVDEAMATSFKYDVATGSYTTISFLLGVDSTRNISGAQTGALDPLNDMFWTWNSGYIMAKLEGTSPVSVQPRQIIEYHIGGFSGTNSVLKKITLALPAAKSLNIQQGKTSEIIIDANIDTWWQNPNDVKFATDAICTSPGLLAKKIADNYGKMFSINNVINN
jgi:hypothetical protein